MHSYKIERLLDRGGFANLYLAKHVKSGRIVVIKENMRLEGKEIAKKEARLLMSMRNPFIIKCFKAFEEDEKLYIVMEFATGEPRNLQQLVAQRGSLNESDVREYLRMLCAALAHVHNARVVHRDIKPANVFLMADGSIRLGDFGIGREMAQGSVLQESARGRGTVPFCAPELLNANVYSYSTDIFALGCTCYYLLTGHLAFQSMTQVLLMSPAPLPSTISPLFSQLITERMMSKAPEDRPTAMQIAAHPALAAAKIVVWRDAHIGNHHNSKILRSAQAAFSDRVTLIAAETNSDAGEVFDMCPDKGRLWVITNRADGGREFIRACRRKGISTPILVFCGRKEGWEEMPGVIISTARTAVRDFLEVHVCPAGCGEEVFGPHVCPAG